MQKKILIVDDDTDLVQNLSKLIESEGMTPISAFNGQEGIKKALDENPDLIILDVMMPEKNGYKVSRELAENDRLKKIPVIMLTAVGDHINHTSYSHADGKTLIADDFIEKPFNSEMLIKRVNQLLGLQ